MARRSSYEIEEDRREAERLAEEQAYRASRALFAEQRGYEKMHREPVVLPMYKCLRCSTLAFDPAVHDAWHASMGQEWRA